MQKESPMQVFRDIRSLLQLHTPLKPILTVDDLCLYTGMSKGWIYKLTSSKGIPHYKPNGKTVVFKRCEIDEWLLKKPVKPRKSLEEIEFEIRTNKQTPKKYEVNKINNKR